MESPFQYGKTVSGSFFTDRMEQKKTLKQNLAGGISTILISPRRWGKSSLVNKCIEEHFKKKKQYRVVMLDLFKIRTEEEFFEVYAKHVIKSVSGKMEEVLGMMKSFFRNLIPKISISGESMGDFSLSFDLKELKSNRTEILDLAENIARKKKIEIILCIDEFQNLMQYENTGALQRELRACWQNHKLVTYCLYGSKRHMMSDIFNDTSNPFYRFGAVMFLGKIHTRHWIAFITKGFRKTDKTIAETHAAWIAETMKNHPYYVQQLSHLVWTLTKEIVTMAILEKAKRQIVETNLPFIMKTYESLSTSQINLLKAVCAGETRLNSSGVMHRFRMGTSGNVSKNKATLAEQDIIDIAPGGIELMDPVFEIWFREYP